MPFAKNAALAKQLENDILAWRKQKDQRRWCDILRNALDIAIDPMNLEDEIVARLQVPRPMVALWKKGPPAPGPQAQVAVIGFIERRLAAP